MAKQIKLTHWQHLVIIQAVEDKMKSGDLHEESAKALLKKLNTLSRSVTIEVDNGRD